MGVGADVWGEAGGVRRRRRRRTGGLRWFRFCCSRLLVRSGCWCRRGYFAWQKACRQASRDLSRDDIENIEDLSATLRISVFLRHKAEKAGVNVEAVVAGYAAMRDQHVSIGEVMLRFAEGRVAAPVDDPHPASGCGLGLRSCVDSGDP